jgi:hypothetical protein
MTTSNGNLDDKWQPRWHTRTSHYIYFLET